MRKAVANGIPQDERSKRDIHLARNELGERSHSSQHIGGNLVRGMTRVGDAQGTDVAQRGMRLQSVGQHQKEAAWKDGGGRRSRNKA